MSETIPMGDCLGYVHRQALKMITGKTEQGIIYQALVTEPFSQPPHSYLHAWVNVNGIVQDWQMMESIVGGERFNKKGMPEELFKELYNPQKVMKFTATEFIKKVKDDGGVILFF